MAASLPDQSTKPACPDCENEGVVWESCGCYECEYQDKHGTYIPCASCSIEHWPSERAWVKWTGRLGKATHVHPLPMDEDEGWVEVVPASELRGAVEDQLSPIEARALLSVIDDQGPVMDPRSVVLRAKLRRLGGQ